ncbi:thiamine transporter 1-like [Clytia hemisphaerica]|uniref:Thiamine transporter 2 n=1 Tax=Clytia hemisphaerica TaxID=252671 RepID=A0A7M5X314_9CNID
MAGEWMKPTLILSLYGFFKEMKPSESFLTPYLNSTFKNIPKKTISDEIYPISTYSYLVFLFLVLMTTDFLRYKPLVIIESLAYLATRVILVWGQGVLIMQIMQMTYGLASATEVAYYSYIYALVDREHYQKVSSYTRLAVLAGKGVGDLSGQLLLSTNTVNLLQLNYVSLASVAVSVIAACFLPKVTGSVFGTMKEEKGFERFDNEERIDDEDQTDQITSSKNIVPQTCSVRLQQYFKNIWHTFKSCYSDKKLLQWSCFWAIAMCGGLQVEDYVMNLWSALQGDEIKKAYNGAVFAAGTITSAVCVFLFSIAKVDWNSVSEVVIGCLSIVQSTMVFNMAWTSDVTIAYVMYVIFRASYAFSLTVASFQIANRLTMDGFGLVFGWNTLVAVCLQSILTLIVVDKNGLDLPESKQFVIYGCYFVLVALIFFLLPLWHVLQKSFAWMKSRSGRQKNDTSKNSTI